MFFDIGWPELMLIGAVALVVIGPKDLPRALRVAGFWVRKARTLSREFQSSVDQMIREAELEEVREELKKATEFDVEKELRNTIDPKGELAEGLRPPDVPDYFAEAEGPETAPGPEPEPIQGELALLAPSETAMPAPSVSGEATPEAAHAAEHNPEPLPGPPDAAQRSAKPADAPAAPAKP